MDKNKIFIGNLSFNTTVEKLLEVFGAYGEITDSYKPERKGFAFITYKDEESAQKAIEAMNEKELDGRVIIVNIARPKEDKPRSFSNQRGGFQKRRYDRN